VKVAGILPVSDEISSSVIFSYEANAIKYFQETYSLVELFFSFITPISGK
jgi:hypothetical protein